MSSDPRGSGTAAGRPRVARSSGGPPTATAPAGTSRPRLRRRSSTVCSRPSGRATFGRLQSGTVRDAFYRGLDNAGLEHLREKEDNPMTFHDLRHTFGTVAVREFDLVVVQAYMDHSEIGTTMRYVHHVPRHDAARRLSAAFAEDRGAPAPPPSVRPEKPSGSTAPPTPGASARRR
ncbi:hypothetical protein C7Y72_06370 [Paraconexibacter algicola]|uniref:Tyr recombinase domain-containing protein n=1 Tax=Paraconexibacter algicola TaxID=2133960 RepID=A0A2T4UJ92_9ACTN|nr:hypothetical protein C7Y72_06370 [Paraconexibacter algicola]